MSEPVDLDELQGCGVSVVLFSEPCLFAARSAVVRAISGLKDANRLLSKQISEGVGLHNAVARREEKLKARDSHAWLRAVGFACKNMFMETSCFH